MGTISAGGVAAWIAALPAVGTDFRHHPIVKIGSQEWTTSYEGEALGHHIKGDTLAFGKFCLLDIEARQDGGFTWKSSLALVERLWYSRSCGHADTPEEAAEAALAYAHIAQSIDGIVWHQAEDLITGRETWTTYFGQREAKVWRDGDDPPNHWNWSREIDLAALRCSGLEGCWYRNELHGETTAGFIAACQLTTGCLQTLRQMVLQMVDAELKAASEPTVAPEESR